MATDADALRAEAQAHALLAVAQELSGIRKLIEASDSRDSLAESVALYGAGEADH